MIRQNTLLNYEIVEIIRKGNSVLVYDTDGKQHSYIEYDGEKKKKDTKEKGVKNGVQKR